MQYPDHLLKLIYHFKQLPGVGTKSAERFAFHVLSWSEEKLREMGQTIESSRRTLNNCLECGFLIEKQCPLCCDQKRDSKTICVIASSKDIFLVEQTHAYRGHYHVLGSLLSPLHGMTPSPQSLEKLRERIHRLGTQEIILTLDSTLEGDATALFLKKELECCAVIISRLALGLPMGSSLDYIDGGTLARALVGRSTY